MQRDDPKANSRYPSEADAKTTALLVVATRPAIGAMSAIMMNALAATPEMKDAVHPNLACHTGMTNPNVARGRKGDSERQETNDDDGPSRSVGGSWHYLALL